MEHADLYPVLERVCEKFIPMWERVLTGLKNPAPLRVVAEPYKWYDAPPEKVEERKAMLAEHKARKAERKAAAKAERAAERARAIAAGEEPEPESEPEDEEEKEEEGEDDEEDECTFLFSTNALLLRALTRHSPLFQKNAWSLWFIWSAHHRLCLLFFFSLFCSSLVCQTTTMMTTSRGRTTVRSTCRTSPSPSQRQRRRPQASSCPSALASCK